MSLLSLLTRKPRVPGAAKGALKLAKKAAPSGGAPEASPEPSLPGLGIVGHQGAGKTVYLAMLHEVCKEGSDPVFRAYDDATAAEILTVIESLRGTTRRFLVAPARAETPQTPRFPPPTTSVRPFTFEAGGWGQRLRLAILDYPGANVSIYEEAGRKRQVNEWLEAAEGMLLLIDPATLASEADAQSQISSYRSLLARATGNAGRRRIPVSLVITKADRIEGFRDDTQTVLIPRSLDRARDLSVANLIEEVVSQPEFQGNPKWRDSVRAILNRLRELIPVLRDMDRGFQIFFVSATGGAIVEEGGGERPPDVLKPVGVREPLRWAVLRLGDRLRIEGRRRGARRALISCAIGAALVSLWSGAILWRAGQTAPRRGATIQETVRAYRSFDRFPLLWLRFLSPQVGRASLERYVYAQAVAYNETFPSVNAAFDTTAVTSALADLERMQRKSPRARDDLRRLADQLALRWDESRIEEINSMVARGGAAKEIDRRVRWILDPIRRREGQAIRDQIGSLLYFPIQSALQDLSLSTYLIPGPLETIKKACDAYFSDQTSMQDFNRARVRQLKKIVEEALAALALPDPPTSEAAIQTLRQQAKTIFPTLASFLSLPRLGGGAGGAAGAGGGGFAGDEPFAEWIEKSAARDPQFNLVTLPKNLRERLQKNLGSAENLQKARDYLKELDQWTQAPGVTLRLDITRQPRQGFHFHLGDATGLPRASEYEQGRPGEFQWKLGQPFVLYLSSNADCAAEIRTISEWRKEGRLSLFDAAKAGAAGDAIFETPDGPFRVEFKILGIEEKMPVLQ